MYTFKKVKPKKLQKNYKKNYLKRDKTNNKIKKNKKIMIKLFFPQLYIDGKIKVSTSLEFFNNM